MLRNPQLTMGGNASNTRGRPTGSQGGQGGARGRSFQMTKNEAEASPDVVTGTFLLNSIHAKVLFDSGANFSFVSPMFA